MENLKNKSVEELTEIATSLHIEEIPKKKKDIIDLINKKIIENNSKELLILLETWSKSKLNEVTNKRIICLNLFKYLLQPLKRGQKVAKVNYFI